MPGKPKPNNPRFRAVLIIEGEKHELVNERKRMREEKNYGRRMIRTREDLKEIS